MNKWRIEFSPASRSTGFVSVLFRCVVKEEELLLGKGLDNLTPGELETLAVMYLVRTGALDVKVRKIVHEGQEQYGPTENN